jgi:hypothetical protein
MKRETNNNKSNAIYIGIDPGKNGGIYICEDLIFTFYPIPLIGKEYDTNTLANIFRDLTNNPFVKIQVIIENVHAIFGAGANATFDFGFGCGLLEGIMASYSVPYTKINPKKWQKEMWQGIPIQQKASSSGKTKVNDTKRMSEMAAKRLFPNIDLRLTERCKNSHDGKVDALLICEYCRRMYNH